jgi:mono/diheme cytochrome c family protein
MLREIGAAFFVWAIASGSSWAEGTPDAFRGKAYAQAICASCHSISPDKPNSPNPAAKPFATMTITHPTGEAFAAWLNTKHPPLPNNLLKPAQADDIIAYVASLKVSAGG